MGRQIRRVALDFDWPLDKVWDGFLSPYSFPPCPDCTYEELPTIMSQLFPSPSLGSGYAPEAYAISQTFYPHMIGGPMADRLAWHDKLGQAEVDNLLTEKRLRDYTHRYNRETRNWESSDEPVTAAMVNAGQRNGGLGPKGAHDAINRSILIRFRCEQLGIQEYCRTCDGNGDAATPEEREAAESWEGTDPPPGDGWQLWETVSEGSPISPVFATGEELAQWMSVSNRAGIGKPVPLDAARRFVESDGWAPTIIYTPERGVQDGITAVAGESS